MDCSEGTPPKEDSIQAFLKVLVDPLLNKYGRFAPSPEAHEQVARQMQAVVLLYNYYHRKQFPDLEFLDSITFCKAAVVSSAKLITYMGLLKGSDMSVSDFVQRSTITEKAVKEACDISRVLDSLGSMSDVKAFPISKVAVFVVDATHEKCILVFGSVTEGVWSLVEKDVEVCDSYSGSEFHMNDCANRMKGKNSSKRQVGFSSNSGDMFGGTKANEVKLLRIALSAVEEQTGIEKSGLKVYEDHLVYSLSRKKTSSRLYIMLCKREAHLKTLTNSVVKWVPIKDALTSVEGPLVENGSLGYEATSAVSYFHLLPYCSIIRDWFSRKESINADGNSQTLGVEVGVEGQISIASDHQDSPLQSPTVNSIGQGNMALKIPISDVEPSNTRVDLQEEPIHMDAAVEGISTGIRQVVCPTDHSRHILKSAARSSNKCSTTVKSLSSAIGPVRSTSKDGGDAGKGMKMSSEKCAVMPSEKRTIPLHISSAIERVTSQSNGRGHARSSTEPLKETLEPKIKSAEKGITANGRQAGGQQTCISPLFSHSERIMPHNNKYNGVHEVSCEHNQVAHGESMFPIRAHENTSNGLEENKIFKDANLTKAAVKVIRQKEDSLFEELINCQVLYQSRTNQLHSEIAQCDAKIKTLLSDGEDAMMLAQEICHQTLSIEKMNKSIEPSFLTHEEKEPVHETKRRKLQSIIFSQSSCQELHSICIKNHWSLPSYCVFNSSDSNPKGSFCATVSIRGLDFELSEGGDVKNAEMDAKESAASYMLSKLHLIRAKSSE